MTAEEEGFVLHTACWAVFRTVPMPEEKKEERKTSLSQKLNLEHFNSINLLLSSRALTQQTLVPVFDATAKPPSGILSGNGNQYGDFDECLSIDGAVRGKYCLASLQVSLEDNFKALDHMVHSGHYIRSNITD
ncbi:Drop dead, partial [Operophtera brumata]